MEAWVKRDPRILLGILAEEAALREIAGGGVRTHEAYAQDLKTCSFDQLGHASKTFHTHTNTNPFPMTVLAWFVGPTPSALLELVIHLLKRVFTLTTT